MGCLDNRNAPVVINLPELTGDGKGESFVFNCKRATIPKITESPKIIKPE
ncbi:hypothetical protein LX77_01748 [Gelidibacter algens]|uniref:Uncharacterized protein n=1 Tax=Gelidibacter algens TaxID=49280 RepID=A0A327S8T5_9FLAO|nr:hypothetical protein LX77_01748 [Gelidibacter algens]